MSEFEYNATGKCIRMDGMSVMESRKREKAEAQGRFARECRGCGRHWGEEELDEDGYCAQCAEYNEEESE